MPLPVEYIKWAQTSVLDVEGNWVIKTTLKIELQNLLLQNTSSASKGPAATSYNDKNINVKNFIEFFFHSDKIPEMVYNLSHYMARIIAAKGGDVVIVQNLLTECHQPSYD